MPTPRGYANGRDEIDALLEASDERLLTDLEWDLVEKQCGALNGDDDRDFALEFVLDVRRSQEGSGRRHRRSKSPPDEMAPVEIPEHWLRQCERLFDGYREEAAVAKLILGLDAPLDAEGLGAYLEEVAAHERHEGDLEEIPYLNALGGLRHVRIHRGYAQKELREAIRRGEVRRLPAPRPVDMTEREWRANPQAKAGRNLRIDWVAPRVNRLCRVADIARKLAEKTGCEAAEATMFLLCDVVPDLPWLEAVVIEYDSGRRNAFSIYVGSPLVPAEDVRRFYVQLREAAAHPTIGGQTKRGRKPWTYELLTFVEERRAKWWPWKDIFKDWNEQYPDHPYKSLPAMQRSFYQARGKQVEPEGVSVTIHPRVFRPRGRA